jgi:hypothetical protein
MMMMMMHCFCEDGGNKFLWNVLRSISFYQTVRYRISDESIICIRFCLYLNFTQTFQVTANINTKPFAVPCAYFDVKLMKL